MKTVKQPSEQAQVAKLIKAFIKERGFACRVSSDSYAGGNSVRVTVTDLLPDAYAEIKAYADTFKDGDFDGMQDLYEYRKNPNNLPRAKYVFTTNEISDELAQKIYDYLRGAFAGFDGAPELYKDAYNFLNAKFDQFAQCMVRKQFSGTYNNDQYYLWVAEQEKMAA